LLATAQGSSFPVDFGSSKSIARFRGVSKDSGVDLATLGFLELVPEKRNDKKFGKTALHFECLRHFAYGFASRTQCNCPKTELRKI
jgi:hypothetical protein